MRNSIAETLRRQSSESRQEERRGRKDENLVSGPFGKPQCLAKYHVQLLVYKEASLDVPFQHWKRKKSLGWPKLSAKTLRLRVWYPQNPLHGDLSTLFQMVSDLWAQVILLPQSAPELSQHTLQKSVLSCNVSNLFSCNKKPQGVLSPGCILPQLPSLGSVTDTNTKALIMRPQWRVISEESQGQTLTVLVGVRTHYPRTWHPGICGNRQAGRWLTHVLALFPEAGSKLTFKKCFPKPMPRKEMSFNPKTQGFNRRFEPAGLANS